MADEAKTSGGGDPLAAWVVQISALGAEALAQTYEGIKAQLEASEESAQATARAADEAFAGAAANIDRSLSALSKPRTVTITAAVAAPTAVAAPAPTLAPAPAPSPTPVATNAPAAPGILHPMAAASAGASIPAAALTATPPTMPVRTAPSPPTMPAAKQQQIMPVVIAGPKPLPVVGNLGGSPATAAPATALPAGSKAASLAHAAAFQQQQRDMAKAAEETKNRVERTQMLLGVGYGLLTAKVMGWVNAGLAGTVEGERLGLMFQFLHREIASVFTPAIHGAINAVTSAVNAFRGLSGEQQATIRNAVAMSGAFLGIATIGPQVVRAVTAIRGAFFGAAGSMNPMLLMASGIGALLVSTERGRASLAALGKAFVPIAEVGAKVFESLLPAAEATARVFTVVAQAIAPIVKALAPIINFVAPVVVLGYVFHKVGSAAVSATTFAIGGIRSTITALGNLQASLASTSASFTAMGASAASAGASATASMTGAAAATKAAGAANMGATAMAGMAGAGAGGMLSGLMGKLGPKISGLAKALGPMAAIGGGISLLSGQAKEQGGLGTAAAISGVVAPFLRFIPVVGPALSLLASGFSIFAPMFGGSTKPEDDKKKKEERQDLRLKPGGIESFEGSYNRIAETIARTDTGQRTREEMARELRQIRQLMERPGGIRPTANLLLGA